MNDKKENLKAETSFRSKKLLITLLVLIGSFFLKWERVIEDWPFVAVVAGVVIFYFFVQGRIDLSKVKKVISDQFSISLEEGPAAEDKLRKIKDDQKAQE